MKKIKIALWFIWGLPQNIVGLIMFLILKPKAALVENYEDSKILYTKWVHGGVSLGMFIFLFGESHKTNIKLKQHEYGHSIQSKILGPLYLLVVGLPSILWAGFIHGRTKKSYYWFYPEKWADKLGGVDR